MITNDITRLSASYAWCWIMIAVTWYGRQSGGRGYLFLVAEQKIVGWFGQSITTNEQGQLG